MNAPQIKQTEVSALSLAKAIDSAVEKLEIDKTDWYLKKYCVMR
jgi:hypothetical protein